MTNTTMLVKPFKTAAKWREWLAKNHAKSAGLWLRIYKKDSAKATVTYAKALDEALCFGWIGGQKKGYDATSFLQRFTPRRPKSVWSKRNREHVARLIQEKRMAPAGIKQIEAAKHDGRWDAAYDSPKHMEIPADFLKSIKRDKAAYKFLLTLNKANAYAIAWRLQTAKKPGTRERRTEMLLAMLASGKKLH